MDDFGDFDEFEVKPAAKTSQAKETVKAVDQKKSQNVLNEYDDFDDDLGDKVKAQPVVNKTFVKQDSAKLIIPKQPAESNNQVYDEFDDDDFDDPEGQKVVPDQGKAKARVTDPKPSEVKKPVNSPIETGLPRQQNAKVPPPSQINQPTDDSKAAFAASRKTPLDDEKAQNNSINRADDVAKLVNPIETSVSKPSQKQPEKEHYDQNEFSLQPKEQDRTNTLGSNNKKLDRADSQSKTLLTDNDQGRQQSATNKRERPQQYTVNQEEFEKVKRMPDYQFQKARNDRLSKEVQVCCAFTLGNIRFSEVACLETTCN